KYLDLFQVTKDVIFSILFKKKIYMTKDDPSDPILGPLVYAQVEFVDSLPVLTLSRLLTMLSNQSTRLHKRFDNSYFLTIANMKKIQDAIQYAAFALQVLCSAITFPD